MRSFAAISALALLSVATFPGVASAGATVDLLFVGVNGSAITPTDTVTVDGGTHPVSVGDTLTMAAIMTNDERLVISVFSLSYDLGGNDELDLVQAFQWVGVPINKAGSAFYRPLGPMSPSTDAFAGSFQGATTQLAPPPGTLPSAGGAFAGGYQMGTVIWRVTAGVTDGDDVIGGLFNRGIDVWANELLAIIDGEIAYHGAQARWSRCS
jgi:hypothetical protein